MDNERYGSKEVDCTTSIGSDVGQEQMETSSSSLIIIEMMEESRRSLQEEKTFRSVTTLTSTDNISLTHLLSVSDHTRFVSVNVRYPRNVLAWRHFKRPPFYIALQLRRCCSQNCCRGSKPSLTCSSQKFSGQVVDWEGSLGDICLI